MTDDEPGVRADQQIRLEELYARGDAPVTRREARLRRGLPLRSKVALTGLSGVGFTASALAMGPVWIDGDAEDEVETQGVAVAESTVPSVPPTAPPSPEVSVVPNVVYVDENGDPLSEAEAAARLAAIDEALTATTSTAPTTSAVAAPTSAPRAATTAAPATTAPAAPPPTAAAPAPAPTAAPTTAAPAPPPPTEAPAPPRSQGSR